MLLSVVNLYGADQRFCFYYYGVCLCVSERGVQVVTMVVRGGEIPCLLLCNMAIKRP